MFFVLPTNFEICPSVNSEAFLHNHKIASGLSCLFDKGVYLGFFLSFLIGPVFFMLIETSITKGVRAAITFNTGVIIADIIFISIAYISSFQLLENLSNLPGLYVFGGSILSVYGLIILVKKINQKELELKKPVFVCGDLNVAHKEIDLKNPKSNYNKSAGYMQEEIDGLNNFINAGFKDTFRHYNPETIKYSWWSYRFNSRARNIGWRIDYFLASEKLVDTIENTFILNEILGSDHCPVGIEM